MSEKSNVSKDERVKQRFRRLRNERLKKAKKIYQVVGAVFCGWVFLLAVVNLIKPSSDFSESENRMLAQMPQFSFSSLADGSFMSGMESYISDQFILRDAWISLKLMEDRLIGKKESNGVYLGKSGYLMEVQEEPNEKGLSNNITGIREFYSRHTDLNIFMTLVPNSSQIMKSKLPANAPVRDQEKDIAMVKDALGNTVRFLDVTTALKDHSREQIYYKTDHHWTTLGAYYAFSAMSSDLGITSMVEGYQPHAVARDFQGTLASKSGYHGSRDTVEVYEPLGIENSYIVTYEDDMTKSTSVYRSECLKDKDKYTVFFGGNHSLVDIVSPNESDRTLLVLKDSYANCFVPFLIPYYREIVIVDPRYYYDSIDQIIIRRNITDVLLLYNVNTFLGDTSLADTLAADEGGPVVEKKEEPAGDDDQFTNDDYSEYGVNDEDEEESDDSDDEEDYSYTYDSSDYDDDSDDDYGSSYYESDDSNDDEDYSYDYDTADYSYDSDDSDSDDYGYGSEDYGYDSSSYDDEEDSYY